MYQLISEMSKFLWSTRMQHMNLLYLFVFIFYVDSASCTNEDQSAQSSQLSFLHDLGSVNLSNFASNVTSDIQSSLHDIMFDSLVMSHNEAELDGSKKLNRHIDPGIATNNTMAQLKQQDSQVNSSSPLPQIISTTTSTSTSTTTTTTTTPRPATTTKPIPTTDSSIDNEDESNRFYWQNLDYGSSFKVTTITPLEILVTPQDTPQDSTIPPTRDGSKPTKAAEATTTSTTSALTDTLNTAESEPNSQEPHDSRQIITEPTYSRPHQPTDLANSHVQFNDTIGVHKNESELQAPASSSNLSPLEHNLAHRPKIEDLLFIVRHLNLARPQIHQEMPTSVDQNNVAFSSLATRLLDNQERLRLPVRGQVSGSLVPLAPEMLAQESQQGARVNRLAKKDLTNAKLDKFTPNDSTKALRPIKWTGSSLPPSLKSRYSLISPYSVDFDSALASDNHPQKRLSPPRTSAFGFSAEDEQTKKQILHDKLRHYHESRIQHNLDKVTRIIAKEPQQVVENATKPTGPSVTYSKSLSAKQKVKLAFGGSGQTQTKRPDATTQDDKSNTYKQGERTSMGKRDMNKSSVSSRRPVGSAGKPDEHKGANSKGEDQASKLQKDHHHQALETASMDNNNNHNNYNFINNNGLSLGNQIPNNLPELSLVNGQRFIQSPIINHLALGGLSSYQRASDDPFKKSLYYTQDGGLFDRGNSPFASRAITFQHGVPFRLRSPTGEKYHLSPIESLDDRIPNDSNQYEDLLYMPYDQQHQQDNRNEIKLDDDIRKHLAIKSIEDPALMARLLESLNIQNTKLTSQAPELNTMAPKKLFANSMEVGSTSEAYHPFASNLSPFATLSNSAGALSHYHPMSSATSDTHTTLPTSNARLPASGNPNDSGINLMMTDLADKWALSRMPDLIPIPLAATVPGYLIRLPDGRLLAAALTNGFSIQGIQKGPLSASYKNFLNTRIKSLIKSSGSKQMTGISHQASGSGVRPIAVPAPIRYAQSQPANNGFKVGGSERLSSWFSRGVLSQLGLSRLSSRYNSTRDQYGSASNNRIRVRRPTAPSSDLLSDQELLNLPINDPNEPIFEFTDESQLVDTAMPELPGSQPPVNGAYSSVLPLASHQHLSHHSPAAVSNLPSSDTELLQSTSSLALRAKLNQLMSLSGLMGDDMLHGKRKRASIDNRRPPKMGMAPFCQLLMSTNIPSNKKG